MKRIFFLTGLCGCLWAGMTEGEFYKWTYEWLNLRWEIRENGDSLGNYIPGNYLPVKKPIPIPAIVENREAANILDSLVALSMKEQKPLGWALDSLRPELISSLPDSSRRQIIYNSYVNQLASLEKAWKVERNQIDAVLFNLRRHRDTTKRVDTVCPYVPYV
ncbi:hypothetical protein JXM67_06010 [candidate division WOR-3 bacterium]|nr:hypothetical protein [candidate division WOR-3 bacterium]